MIGSDNKNQRNSNSINNNNQNNNQNNNLNYNNNNDYYIGSSSSTSNTTPKPYIPSPYNYSFNNNNNNNNNFNNINNYYNPNNVNSFQQHYNNNNNNNNNYNSINDNITNEIIKEDELFIDAFPRKKKNEFFDIPTIGKIFLICVFLELIFGFSMLIVRFATWNGWDENIKISIIGLASSLFLFYYSFDSIWNENKFQLFTFIFIMSTISLGGVYQFYHIWNNNRDVVNYIRFISVLVFIPLNIILGIFSYQRFGWKTYRKLGTSIELRKLYKNYQMFLSLIKIDNFLFGLILINVTFFYSEYWFEIYINIGLFLINLLWSIIGFKSIKEENKKLIKFFLFTSWLSLVYNLWKISIAIYQLFNGIDTIQFMFPLLLFSIISILSRILVIIYSFKSLNNFDKGLIIVFKKEKKNKQLKKQQQKIQNPIINIINNNTNNNNNNNNNEKDSLII